MTTNVAARSRWLKLPKPQNEDWRDIADTMVYRVTEMDVKVNKLRAENTALIMQVQRLQARNQELWDTYVAHTQSIDGPPLSELADDLGVMVEDLIQYAVESTGAGEE